jgi:hypothetical protein
MIATNHYLAGVAVAATLSNPWYAIPVAFASHFVLDALPHFGLEYSTHKGKVLTGVAVVDALVLLFAALLILPNYPTWFIVAGLIAISPDGAWIYRFIVKEKFGSLPPAPYNSFNKWHAGIQKLESPWGMLVEIGFVIAMLALLA